MNGKKARAFRRKDEGRATPGDLVIIARAYKKALAMSKMGPKPLDERTRKPAGMHHSGWPFTDNQKLQSRPVIVMRPVRALAAKLMEGVVPVNGVRTPLPHHAARIRAALRAPKHVIDQLAMR